jgi:hypothetical protein
MPSSNPSGAYSHHYPPFLSEAALATLKKQWKPETKPQLWALNSDADLLCYGGAAGGGKTEFLLVDAAAEFRNNNLRAILFRESFPQLRDIIRKAYRIYKKYPYYGRYNKTDHVWSFPTNAKELADPRNIERVVAWQEGKQYTPDGEPALAPVYIDGHCASVSFAFLDNDDRCEDHQGQEYSWIGFDESTHHSEYQIQYLLTRLRSTDSTLRLRMRLATNPGGDGHVFHMKVFIGEVCPHCYPLSPKARKPFVIYKDARWSDGTPLSQVIDGVEIVYTTQFIPARLTDHNLFGANNAKYKAQLRMQRPTTAKALEEGCWAVFEGQYFTCWEESRGVVFDELTQAFIVPKPDMRMVVPACDLPDIEYWWPHFTGTDYGFTISNAAAYLFARTPRDEWFPNGRVIVLDEYCEPGKLAEDVAIETLQKWFLELRNGEWVVPERPRAIQAWFLSPDADNSTGVKTGQGISLTRMSQMQAVIGKYGMSYTKAANEREGGWQHGYRMLRSGELVICGDRCPRLVEAIPSRIRDEKKFDDIKKMPGDPLDDCVDAWRYGYYSWFKVGAMPLDLELAERTKNLDPTNAMMTRGKLAQEVRAKTAPIFLGRNAKLKQKLWMNRKNH